MGGDLVNESTSLSHQSRERWVDRLAGESGQEKPSDGCRPRGRPPPPGQQDLRATRARHVIVAT